MKTSRILVLMLVCSGPWILTPVSGQEPPYGSLEEFCLATGIDTPANCACGQDTADELLTAEEKQLVLGFMMRDAAAMNQISQLADQDELMAKLARITEGCT